LIDRSGRHDLAQLRSLQDWFLQVRTEEPAQRRRSRQHRRHGQDSIRSCSIRYKLASYRVPLGQA
jgi:hypothetical protein